MAVAIRELGVSDGHRIEELLDHLSVGWTDGLAPSANGAVAFLTDSNSFAFAAYVDHEPAGWAWGTHIRRPQGSVMTYVHEIDVVERYRRRGIASMLVESVIALARRKQSHRVWLITRDANEPARALYDSLGGDDTDERFRRYRWELE